MGLARRRLALPNISLFTNRGIDAVTFPALGFVLDGGLRNAAPSGRSSNNEGEITMISRDAVLQTLNCSPNQYPQMLEERFPHVLEKIVTLWNSPDGEAYLVDLLQPNGRGGGRFNRDGFPERAWQEIFFLKQLYDKPRPKARR